MHGSFSCRCIYGSELPKEIDPRLPTSQLFQAARQSQANKEMPEGYGKLPENATPILACGLRLQRFRTLRDADESPGMFVKRSSSEEGSPGLLVPGCPTVLRALRQRSCVLPSANCIRNTPFPRALNPNDHLNPTAMSMSPESLRMMMMQKQNTSSSCPLGFNTVSNCQLDLRDNPYGCNPKWVHGARLGLLLSRVVYAHYRLLRPAMVSLKTLVRQKGYTGRHREIRRLPRSCC